MNRIRLLLPLLAALLCAGTATSAHAEPVGKPSTTAALDAPTLPRGEVLRANGAAAQAAAETESRGGREAGGRAPRFVGHPTPSASAVESRAEAACRDYLAFGARLAADRAGRPRFRTTTPPPSLRG